MREASEKRFALREERLLDDSSIHRLLDRPLAEDAIADATERIAQPRTVATSTTRGYLHFRQLGESFLIPSVEINCTTRPATVRRIPHRTHRIVRGLCHIDGDLILCGDLTELLELGPRHDQPDQNHARMIVLGQRERWAVQVDAIEGVVQLDPSASRQPPVTVREARRRFVTGLMPIRDRLAALLNARALVTAFQESLS